MAAGSTPSGRPAGGGFGVVDVAEHLLPPDGSAPLLFVAVPEAESVKNRLHLDLRPTDRTRDEEVERLLALGATRVEDHRGLHGPGTGWVVLGDPEHNELCILRSRAELG